MCSLCLAGCVVEMKDVVPASSAIAICGNISLHFTNFRHLFAIMLRASIRDSDHVYPFLARSSRLLSWRRSGIVLLYDSGLRSRHHVESEASSINQVLIHRTFFVHDLHIRREPSSIALLELAFVQR